MAEKITIKDYVKKTLRPYLSPEDLEEASNSKLFELAFTHKSYDPINNYDFLEFKGDSLVNLAICQYIRLRFHNIRSMAWLNKMSLTLRNTQYLSTLATRQGYHYLGRYKTLPNIPLTKKEMLETMEDYFEAFMGAVSSFFDEKFGIGVGYSAVFLITKSFFDELNIRLVYDYFFDYISRAQELVRTSLKMDLKTNIKEYTEMGKQKALTKYYVATSILKITDSGGDVRDVQIESVGSDKGDDLKQKHHFRIINRLKKYDINEKMRDPYENDYIEKYEDPDEGRIIIEDDFKTLIISFLGGFGLKKDVLSEFTSPSNLLEYRLCFVDNSYNPYYNNNLYNLTGTSIIDSVIVAYVINKYPSSRDESTLTDLKHRYGEGNFLRDLFYEDYEFNKFILIGETKKKHIPNEYVKLYLKMKKESMNALFGCFSNMMDKIYPGLSYRFIYFFMSKYFKRVQITKTEEPFTKLKIYYDRHAGQYGKLKENVTSSSSTVENIIQHTINIYHNGKTIATATARNKSDAKRFASEKALKYFKIS